VPDHAEFTIDVRSTSKITHTEIIERLKAELGDEATIEILVNMSPVSTSEHDPFIQLVYDVCNIDRSIGTFPKALPYLTDGSVLQHYYKGVPTVILGPGQSEMAHQTDEFCYVSNIERSVKMYKNIILKRRINND
jgi:succinyl-diaminopimelate desuccinylase